MTQRAGEIIELARQLSELNPTRAALLSGGLINENWLISGDDGSFVLRRYPEGRRRKQVEFEIALHDHLVPRGCRVPSVLRTTTGESVTIANGRCIVLLEALRATPLTQEEALLVAPARLASLLNPIDEALDDYRPPFRPIFETRVFEARLPSLLRQLTGEPNLRDQIRREYEACAHWEGSIRLPCRAIHADIHPGNVLLERDADATRGMWLIDFDDAHVSYRAIDWILPALEFSFTRGGAVDEARYTEILSALSVRATNEELDAFPKLRRLMVLKFAVSLADCGKRLDENPYLQHFVQQHPSCSPGRLDQ